MTETEKRRRELLQQTRKIYSEQNVPPAVHPRYGAVYHSLYGAENKKEEKKGSFGIRLLISILLFGLFVAASKSDFDTQTVAGEIKQEFQGFADLPIFD